MPSTKSNQLKIENAIGDLELLIRTGKFDVAEKLLFEFPLMKVPREFALKLANLSRRMNHCSISLQILSPIVRGDEGAFQPATPEEQIEYAESLRKLGAAQEALQLLNQIDTEKHPAVLFHKSLCHFSNWNYESAIPLLEAYIRGSDDAYQSLIGQINLSAALINVDRLSEATSLLHSMLKPLENASHNLLLGCAFELLAQIALKESDYSKTEGLLQRAESILSNTQSSVEKLWVQKWKAVSQSLQTKSVSPLLHQTIEIATKLGHWETIRDCTLHMASIQRDQSLMAKVYFGSPFMSYRKNILKGNQQWFNLPANYDLNRSIDGDVTQTFCLNNSSFLDGSKVQLSEQPYQLLRLLLSDFFRPFQIITIYSKLFPNEFYNPFSSPNRVHQAIKRARSAYKKAGLGISIYESDGLYQIGLHEKISIRLSTEGASGEIHDRRLQILTSHFREREFSIQEAWQINGGSISSVQRLLKRAVVTGKIEITGAGKKTRYKRSA